MKKDSLHNYLIATCLFVFAFVTLMQKGGSGVNNPVVAKVGSVKIKVSDVRKYIGLIELPEGVDRNSEEVQSYLFHRALEVAIRRSLITQECKSLGLVVSKNKVKESILKNENFQVEGTFYRNKFLGQLAKNGITEYQFMEIEKENLLHKQWYFIISNSYKISKNVMCTVESAFRQKRSIRYGSVFHNSVSVPNPTEVQLKKFYEENKVIFEVKARKVYEIAEVEGKSEVDLQVMNKMMVNKKFALAVKKYGLKTFFSNNSLPYYTNLINAVDKQDLEIGESTGLYSMNGKHYSLKLVKIISSYIPDFNSIKKQVKAEYIKNFQKNNVSSSNVNWKNYYNLSYNSQIDLPADVVEAIFNSPKGKVMKIQKNDITYFFIIDSITHSKEKTADIELISSYVYSNMNNEIIEAALRTLRYKYKIVVLI